ncbi:alpha/beta hydrolase [Planctomycetota bacterium]
MTLRAVRLAGSLGSPEDRGVESPPLAGKWEPFPDGSLGRVSPMIVVMPNGLRGNTMYCDSRDGQYPVETVIINDLIPHVDATYRTVASREGRAVEGFSMGGFGAAHMGFKYPDLFGVVSIAARVSAGSMPDRT